MNWPKSHIPNFPRPRFTRPHFLILDGGWDFRFDDENLGIHERWYEEWASDQSIIVPFSYQTKMSGIEDSNQHQICWYHRDVHLDSFDKVLLHLDKSDYLTMVWVNGIYIGQEEGGYHRLSMDITHAIKQGDNSLVCRVIDTWDTTQPRGKQRWKEHSFGCWYVETTGIYQSAWLEYVPYIYIKDVEMIPHNEVFSTDFNLELSSIKEGLEIETIVMYDDIIIASAKHRILKTSTHYTLSMKTQKDQFKLMTWHPDHPYLYDVIIKLYEQEKVIDEVKSYLGMRQFSSKGRNIYLNDEPIYLKMLLDQGYWPESGLTAPNQEALLTDLKLTKAMGYNGIRKHQKIEDERFYYYADVLGLLIWLEMPSAYEFSPHLVTKMSTEWPKIVKQHKHYASIMTYVLFNESWGIPHVKTSTIEQNFTMSMYYLTKALDPSRFVISNDGWEHTKSDIITIHNYVAEGKELYSMYQKITDVFNNQTHQTNVRSVFSDGYHDHGQPIIFSEYGGVSFQSDEGWGYGAKVSTKDAFKNRLLGLTQAIRSIPEIQGYCLTQTTDVEQETNGVLTPKRAYKLSNEDMLDINEVKR